VKIDYERYDRIEDTTVRILGRIKDWIWPKPKTAEELAALLEAQRIRMQIREQRLRRGAGRRG
jgi:hypothetical protein